ncbi:hypothetical protein WR25_19036 [Diploscapter pachys]|uniref:Delta(3,5)-Delta(2,4)-dienoyl-CoA isomerase, mitochondrial n=1 Tax=Diploscapter pachys TaxID=2018661 RepID=A0A2A2JJU7_9BILA|nr:hypothetical protein WR25_19036 [Diploscapter pachys]
MAQKYSYEFLKVQNFGDYVWRVSLNRPNKRNALNLQIWNEIGDVFVKLDEDKDCRVIILDGEGKSFCAGIDLNGGILDKNDDENLDVAREARFIGRKIAHLQQCFTNIEKCCKPVIAVVHGACVGGGVDLIAACDIRHCSEDAFFSIKEVDVGLAADVGSLNRLPKLVGNHSWLREIAYTARNIKPQEALEFGLVNQIHKSKEDMAQSVATLAKEIASKSPVAIQGTKVVLNYSKDHSTDESLNFTVAWNASQLQTEDIPKSAMASFSKKELPEFSKL